MTNRHDQPGDAADMRRRAEERAREAAARTPEDIEALSPEQTRRALHELRVHQIQLEMQNEELRRAQAELDAARARYFDLYDLAPVGYCTVSEQGLILEANLTAAGLLGVPRGALVKRRLTGLILPADEDTYYLHRKQLFETGEPQVCQLRMVRQDGTAFWAQLAATAAEDADGARVCRVVMSDITERKLNEADRETMLALLRLVNASNNTRELIRAVTAELQGWSGCEAVGIRLRDGDDFPYYETRGFPAKFVQAESHLCARNANGELLRDGRGAPVLECMCGNILSGRFDARLPSFTPGGSFWTNNTTKLLTSTTEADRQSPTRNCCNTAGYESVALIPLRASGRILGLLQFNDRRPDRFTIGNIALMERVAASLAIALDQRSTQAALLASEERYRLISENSADVIWVLDLASRRFTYVSPSVKRLRGYSPEEVMAQPLEHALTPGSSRHVARLLAELPVSAAGGETAHTRTSQVDQLRKDGSIVRTEVVTTFLRNPQGRVDAILGVSRDITERLKAEAQLQQALKMESVGRLAGGVAHDFNNLLTVINGYSQLLLQKLSPADPLRAGLEQIRKAGERAAALTRQLLAFSRKQVLELRVLDLNRVVEEMGPMLERLVGEDVEVRVAANAERGMVHADPHQLDQVLVNLAVNARDAMPGGGRLLIETSLVERDAIYAQSHPEAHPGRYVMLAVSDTGVGMDEETRRQIFEPFFTTKEVGKGTGLGLSTVQGIVAQSGGFIDVYSEPGLGTTFRICLPALAQGAADAGRPATVPVQRGNETVLVVEDRVEVREYAVAVLKEYGYRVTAAESAGEALLLSEREPRRIDLVLTDVVMPNMSGRELAEQLKGLRPGIKVLFMSGYTDDAVTRDGFLNKGAEFIQKPFSAEELAAKIRAVLGAA
jgi:PAS domain S-box-containing protein